MRLYQGTTKEFVEDVLQNRIADKLKNSYENYYGRRVNQREYTSWINSLRFVKDVIEHNLLVDNMIIIEFELPYSTKRIDVMLFGKDINNNDTVVIMELKQWSKVEDCDIENNIITYVGGAPRMVVHPSIQVRAYHLFLKDFIKVFDEETNLFSCVYCHNYSTKGNPILFKEKFKNIIRKFPLFGKEDFENIGSYLKTKIGNGDGLRIFNNFIRSPIQPTKKLLEHTHRIIEGNPTFTLIDEQLIAYNTIVSKAKKLSKSNKKTVIIVQGGPGTGKSVIALNVMAELLSRGQKVFHATGSKAFTETLRKIVGSRASNLFKYFNSFTKTDVNSIDVLICDEAHRIRKSSNSRWTRRELRSSSPQIDELINASKLSIFFIDDDQVVRPTEIGSSKMIKESAKKFGADIYEFELKTQFRCSGSDGYLNWVNNILGIKETANLILTKNEKMDFRIFDSPQKLYEEIKKKNAEKPNSARMVAGFCWPWSDTKPDGTLVEDVVIGDFKMTWEAKNDSRKLAPGVVKAALWAYDPRGVNQMGSIYTIQGFEFDYVGVIFANDLVYDPIKKEWIGKKENSCDNSIKKSSDEVFLKHVKNIYRVLLTRGMKGCYVYFLDKNTENYFKSRIEKYFNN